jgi:hypothetical protein
VGEKRLSIGNVLSHSALKQDFCLFVNLKIGTRKKRKHLSHQGRKGTLQKINCALSIKLFNDFDVLFISGIYVYFYKCETFFTIFII